MVVVYGEILVDMVKEKGNNSFNYLVHIWYKIEKVKIK